MKLTDLDPAWVSRNGRREIIVFDCPICQKHKIAVPIPPHPKAWDMKGDDFTDLTLSPSIQHTNEDVLVDGTGQRCESHFFITNGEIKIV